MLLLHTFTVIAMITASSKSSNIAADYVSQFAWVRACITKQVPLSLSQTLILTLAFYFLSVCWQEMNEIMIQLPWRWVRLTALYASGILPKLQNGGGAGRSGDILRQSREVRRLLPLCYSPPEQIYADRENAAL